MRLSARFREALDYAAQVHETQLRKGTEIPYVSHLLAVCAIVLEHGGTEDEAVAALLHDAIEDQGGAARRDAIAARFGVEVARIVDECSDTDEQPKPPWRERKERYLAHLVTADPSVLLVSAADKVHNARSILRGFRLLGDALWPRFRGGRDGVLWYYRSLVDTLCGRGMTPLFQELAEAVADLEAAVYGASAGSGASDETP